ncbi:uncharacterized protein LOC133205982 [Saccostrea echinata]|uniref:uncharacterized protein LOC133205982 n=1 Tax=Saccostrea echinata TaxID=191078 RepID=UPI002A7F5950|nr:uncharacterized protein LOC133205982 [Saccostrea echinata]
MSSMFQASKQLQAIRNQLKQMDKQYRDGFKTEYMEDSSEAKNDDSNQLRSLEFANKAGTNEETSDSTSATQSITESSNVQSLLAGQSYSPVTEFEHVESVLSTLIEDSHGDSQEIMPLSHELRQAITNMEDIEDVDSLIGDVMNSVQIDSSYDEDLHCIEQAVTCTISKTNSEGNQPVTFSSKEEERTWKKERIKKDNHNIIERRRRYNINDRIKELATLLPPNTHPAMKLNKGSILKASVEYVKELKKDKQKLISFEANQKAMEAKYQKMLIRIFQLELKMKLYGLTEDIDRSQTKRKKRPRRRLCEIDAMVEDLMKNSLPEATKSDGKSMNQTVDKQSTADIQHSSKITAKSAKTGLRNFISKKLACDSTKNRNQIKTSNSSPKLEIGAPRQYSNSRSEENGNINHVEKNINQPSTLSPETPINIVQIPEQTEASNHEHTSYSLFHSPSSAELSLDQCNLLLDLFGADNMTILQPESEAEVTPVSSPSQIEDKCTSPVLSPVTLTTNLLEALLRKSDGSSSSSETNSLETSTEST